jgi:hypothetical protein
MREFVELLDAVNTLADATPGFVWRLKTDAGDSTGIRAYADPLVIVNMSVWSGIEALRAYVYRSSHADAFRRRKNWFEEMNAPSFGLWWIPAGQIPSVEDGKARLEMLAKSGAGPEAFTFKEAFPPPQ